MIFDVQITSQAERDLRQIFEYIYNELQSPINANNQLDRLEDRITRLDQMPFRYRLYEREPWKSRGLRVMPVDNYLVFYIPDEQTQIVNVVRVMYGGRNVTEILDKTTE